MRAGLAVLSFLSLVCLKAHAAPPNVLVIIGDDHAAYALGCYGSKIARTPNLDNLAKQGMLFSHAYCNSPVCTPSRQSLLTGLMPHAAGVTLLSTPLSANSYTLAKHLSSTGYDTAAFGKMHFNSKDRHGFDDLLDNPDFDVYMRSHPGRPLPEGVKTTGPWKPFKDPARIWLNADCLPYPAHADEMDGAYFAKHAVEYLKTPREKPFYLVASFNQPHSPFRFPVEMAGNNSPERMPIPKIGPQDLPQVPLIFREMTPRDTQGVNAAYYTSVAYLDKQVGTVLDALEASGKAGNTLVMYIGDNGYCLGEHGRFEKHCFYEEAVRVPLIMRWPGHIKRGARVDSLVEYVDLVPTICEATGIRSPTGLHGHSLAPLFGGGWAPKNLRKSIVSVYFENEEAMIRTTLWKLIYCTGKRERQDGYKTDNPTPGRYVRLYDMTKDPGEMHDISRDAAQAATVTDLKRQLLDRLNSTAPSDLQMPKSLTVDEGLDWRLVPPEVRSGTSK